MNRIISCLILIVLPFLSDKAAAQSAETGRESVRAEMNFTALAHYYATHPEPLVVREVQNEEEAHPVRPAITDLSLIHRRPPTSAFSSLTATSYLPVSASPTDTFQSTLDNGTSIPPDTHGAVDSNYCVTTINTVVHIQTRAGANVSSVSLNGFWSSLVSGGTFDPRVHYDPYYHRWVIIAVADGHLATSSMLIAVSKTSNPTGAWWMYKVPVGSAGYWLDYPNVGFNKKWVVVTGNLFGIPSGYGGCKSYIFNYADLMSGAGAPFTAFTQATSGTIQPTATYSATLENIFCVESWNGSSGGGGTLRMWKISGAVGSESMTSIGFPSATGFNWQNDGGGGDFAPQLGTSNKLQTNDDRIFSAVYMNNRIWCTHTVFLPATGAPTRSSVLWWQIDTFGNPLQTGLIDDPTATNFLAFPSIAANVNNDAMIGFTQFSASNYPNAAYAIHLGTDPVDSTRPWVVYRHGRNTYYKVFSGTENRWGDYSNTMIDPLNLTDFWTIQETSAATVNTWDTWWAHLSMCNITATITPAGPTSFCSGGSVALNATTGAGYTYQWQLGASPIAGATASSYAASLDGNYTVVISNSTCSATSPSLVVTVNPLPAAITGTTTACPGTTTTLSSSSSGGSWASGTTSVATVGGTGIVTGVGLGISTITYTLPTGCFTTTIATINPAPLASVTAGGPLTFCSGGSVALNANPGAGLTYQWRQGGSNIAGATNITYSASAAGTYDVVVSNASGCATTSTPAVTVNVTPGPGATITPAGPTTFCTPGSVVLNANTGAGITYQWQLGGVNIPGATASSYTASASGSYAVIVSLGACVVTSAPTVVTVLSATPGPITGPTAVCIGLTITLSNSVTGGTWTSSNPSVGVINALGVVTGLTTGTTTITYSVTNACGTGFTTTTVNVSPGMAIAPITGTLSVCAGGTTVLACATSGGTWTSANTTIATIGSTTGIAAGVSVGMVPITYSVSVSGCVSQSTATLNVTSPYSATIVPAGPTTFCSGASVMLNVATGTGYTYQWRRNGVNIPGAISPSYMATTTGNYTVVVTHPGGCYATSAAVAVTVTAGTIVAPSVNISATPGTLFCLATSSATFTAVPLTGAGVSPSYQWYVNGIPTAAGLTYTYTPVAGDVVKVVMTSSEACAFPVTASNSDTIAVSPLVTPTVSILANKSAVCTGDTITFTPVPVYGGTAPTYTWNLNGVYVSAGSSYKYSPSNGDILRVTMTSNYPCVSIATATSPSYVAAVQPVVPNTISIYATKMSIASGTVDTFVAVAPYAGTSPSYQWRLNGAAIIGATNSMYITSVLTDGSVMSCQVTSSEPCVFPRTAHSSGLSVRVWPVGVQTDPFTGNKFTLVPNPNKGSFTIEGSVASLGDASVNILITNALGQTVYNESAEVVAGKLNKHVSLSSSVANGTYMVLITSGAEHMIYHVVVER